MQFQCAVFARGRLSKLVVSQNGLAAFPPELLLPSLETLDVADNQARERERGREREREREGERERASRKGGSEGARDRGTGDNQASEAETG